MNKNEMVSPESALPGGRAPVLEMPFFHRVTGDRLDRSFPGSETIYLAMRCFWGAEKLFWSTDGVLQTAVGYMGGLTPNPTYREVCTGRTGHAETVRVTCNPNQISTETILTVFLENHDPTQGMRQGNDVGTQYRSAIWCTTTEQFMIATTLRGSFQTNLLSAGYGGITTAISMADSTEFYLAEAEHQQYLAASPMGYACDHRTGVSCAPNDV